VDEVEIVKVEKGDILEIRAAMREDIPAMMAIEAQAAGAGHWQAGDYARIFGGDGVRRVALVAESLASAKSGSTDNTPTSANPGQISTPGSARRLPGAPVRGALRIMGFIVAQCLGPEWEIENVAVVAPARRCGVGRRLVDEVIRMARRQGAEAVYLEVRESNAAARGLYGRVGFEETGRRRRYYSDPEEDAVVCSLSVSEA
jgi:ribosomal-protein-alanine acetyltransferase